MVPEEQQPSRLETVPHGEKHLRVLPAERDVVLGLVPGQGVEGQGRYDHIEGSPGQFFTRELELIVNILYNCDEL